MDDSSVPLLAKFRTSRYNYCYDANTGLITKVNESVFNALREERPFDSSARELPEEPGNLGAGREQRDQITKNLGIFKPASVRSTLAHPSTVRRCMHETLGHLSRMTLEVTDRCNLRCQYCPYTLGWSTMRRHGNSEMSWETARRAIDYFVDQLDSVDSASHRPTLGFYGGEPCLAPNLIQHCVDYTLKRVPDVQFTCTTNGVLLTDSLADYFAAHNFNLLISLDGPAEIHDCNRTSAGGGSSFDRVWANVNHLHDRHSDYYYRSVHFQATISNPSDCGTVVRFFLSQPALFRPGQVRVVPSSDESIGAAHVPAGVLRLLDRYESKLLSNQIGDDGESRLLRALFEQPFLAVHHRPIQLGGIESDRSALRFPCFPGFGRIFVATDGTFYICEKIGRQMECGNVASGIDPDKVLALYGLYWQRRHDVCYRCWAIGLCGRCYLHLVRSAQECNPTAEQRECRDVIEFYRRVLTRYCAIVEENPEAFRYLDHVVVMGSPLPNWGALKMAGRRPA